VISRPMGRSLSVPSLPSKGAGSHAEHQEGLRELEELERLAGRGSLQLVDSDEALQALRDSQAGGVLFK